MSVDTNPKDYLMQYDADKDVWKSLASMPTARYATYSFLIRDKLYVLGMYQVSKVIILIHGFTLATSVTDFDPFGSKQTIWR